MWPTRITFLPTFSSSLWVCRINRPTSGDSEMSQRRRIDRWMRSKRFCWMRLFTHGHLTRRHPMINRTIRGDIDSMADQLLAALLLYGLPVLFAIILIASIGVPLPVTLMLVAAGSFAKQGEMKVTSVIIAASSAA